MNDVDVIIIFFGKKQPVNNQLSHVVDLLYYMGGIVLVFLTFLVTNLEACVVKINFIRV